MGQFGAIAVYVFDPYTIALSKLDRDLIRTLKTLSFLISRGYVRLEQLEAMALTALERAREFDLDPVAVRAHLQAVREQL